MFLEGLSWVMSGIALTGTLLNAHMKKEGFYLWMVSNLYMVIADYQAGLYAQSVLFLIYFILAVRGLYIWNVKQNRR